MTKSEFKTDAINDVTGPKHCILPFIVMTYLKIVKVGGVKANGREPKSCFGQVFNFKLDSFALLKEVHGAN